MEHTTHQVQKCWVLDYLTRNNVDYDRLWNTAFKVYRRFKTSLW